MNLVPAVGQINGERSKKPFDEIVSGKKMATYSGDGKRIVISSRLVIPDPMYTWLHCASCILYE